MNEIQRIQQVLSGNTSAFSYFVETYQHMAITIAFRICDNMQDAEDIVQESFVKAYRNLHTFRKESKFSSWLYRIVYNTAITHFNAPIWKYQSDTPLDDLQLQTDFDVESKIAATEQAAMIADILKEMPKGDALLLTLYYLEDHSVKEVAKIIGLNESNVKVRLFRARQLFKQLWLRQYQAAGF